VRVVNQPVLFRWQDDSLYVQAFPPLAVKKGKTEASSENVLDDDLSNKMWQVAKPHAGFVDLPLTKSVVEESRGIAVPVSRRGVTLESLFVTARRVENAVPEGATWAGNEAENPGDPDPQPVAAAGIGQGR
jgi:hypothetical protein